MFRREARCRRLQMVPIDYFPLLRERIARAALSFGAADTTGRRFSPLSRENARAQASRQRFHRRPLRRARRPRLLEFRRHERRIDITQVTRQRAASLCISAKSAGWRLSGHRSQPARALASMTRACTRKHRPLFLRLFIFADAGITCPPSSHGEMPPHHAESHFDFLRMATQGTLIRSSATSMPRPCAQQRHAQRGKIADDCLRRLMLRHQLLHCRLALMRPRAPARLLARACTPCTPCLISSLFIPFLLFVVYFNIIEDDRRSCRAPDMPRCFPTMLPVACKDAGAHSCKSVANSLYAFSARGAYMLQQVARLQV